MSRARRTIALLLVAFIGIFSGFTLWNLVVDYADSTASANMLAPKLLYLKFEPIGNETLSAQVGLRIDNPARGRVNITYLSYQLLLGGEYIVGGSKDFSPGGLVVSPLSSVELELTFTIPTPQDILSAPKHTLTLALYLTTKTNYGFGTLNFTLAE